MMTGGSRIDHHVGPPGHPGMDGVVSQEQAEGGIVEIDRLAAITFLG